jgi:hypothetical protein
MTYHTTHSRLGARTLLRSARIAWGVVTATAVLFCMLGLTSPGSEEAALTPHLDELLALVAAVIAVLSVVLPLTVFADALAEANLRTEAWPNDASGGFRDASPMTRVIANPDDAMATALGVYRSPFVIGMALAASIALLGLVLAHLGADVEVVAGFFAVAILLMAVKFPREAVLRTAIEQATKARFP